MHNRQEHQYARNKCATVERQREHNTQVQNAIRTKRKRKCTKSEKGRKMNEHKYNNTATRSNGFNVARSCSFSSVRLQL